MTLVLTRDRLKKMSEADLRKALLKLFEAMGFKEVTEHHGSTEAGKDLVMWQPDPVRSRLHYAVVVKAKRIAGGRGVQEVVGQVRECFGESYTDPVNLELREVDRVLVVTSGDVTKPARDQLRREFEALNWARRIDLLDGEKLFSRFREYMPKAVVWDALETAKKGLDQVTGDQSAFRFGLEVGPEGRSTIFMVPGDSAQEHPISGNLKLKIPTTVAGEQFSKQWHNWRETGEPITIQKEFIEELGVEPDWLYSLGGGGSPELIRLDAQKLAEPIPYTFEVVGDGQILYALSPICFTHTMGGTREGSVDNRGQNLPFLVRWVYDKNRDAHRYQLKLVADKRNVLQLFRWETLRRAMAKAKKVVFRDFMTGIVTAEAQPDKAELENLPGDQVVELLRRLLLIQIGMEEKIYFPEDHELSPEEIEAIWEASSAVSQGYYLANITDVAFGHKDEESLRRKLGEECIFGPVLDRSDYSVRILEKDFSLGPRLVIVRGILQENPKAETREDKPFLIEVQAKKNAGFLYPNWPKRRVADTEPAEDSGEPSSASEDESE